MMFIAIVGYTVAGAGFLQQQKVPCEDDSCGGAGGNGVTPAMTLRQWHFCNGKGARTASSAEVAAGLEVSSTVMCSRGFTFMELCCADFSQLVKYLDPDSEAPFGGAREANMAMASSQIPHANPDVALRSDAPPGGAAMRLCTTQFDDQALSADDPGPVINTDEECINHEFLLEDISGSDGEMVLDARIAFLEKQGLPGSAIPVCHELFNNGGAPMSCPAHSGRAVSGKPGYNSASPGELERIGKPLPAAALARVDREMAQQPENQPLEAEQGYDAWIREHRHVDTLKSLLGKPAAELTALLGGELDVVLQGTLLRLAIENITAGEQVEIDGKVDGAAAQLRISEHDAELLRGGVRQQLGVHDVVLAKKRRAFFLALVPMLIAKATTAYKAVKAVKTVKNVINAAKKVKNAYDKVNKWKDKVDSATKRSWYCTDGSGCTVCSSCCQEFENWWGKYQRKDCEACVEQQCDYPNFRLNAL